MKWEEYKQKLRSRHSSEGPQFPSDQEFPPDINSCSRCGNDMGQGMTGFDKETNQPICLNCWREGHPEGVSHPNLGFEVLPIGDPRANLPQHNDLRWSATGSENNAQDMIDTQVYLDQDGESLGPYIVVDAGESSYGPYIVLRVDIDGNDASMSQGQENVDWEYVTIDLNDRSTKVIPA